MIWKLRADQIESAGQVLGRAFADEPVFAAVAPSPDVSLEMCTETFTANLRHAYVLGEAWAVGPDEETILGAAYTVLKPEPDLTPAEMTEFGFTRLMERWGSLLSQIGAAEEASLRALEPMPASWRYLAGIGIEPGHQGKGLGSDLMRFIIARVREADEPFATMTDRDINVTFYQRLGFDVRAEGEGPGLPVHWWALVLRDE